MKKFLILMFIFLGVFYSFAQEEYGEYDEYSEGDYDAFKDTYSWNYGPYALRFTIMADFNGHEELSETIIDGDVIEDYTAKYFAEYMALQNNLIKKFQAPDLSNSIFTEGGFKYNPSNKIPLSCSDKILDGKISSMYHYSITSKMFRKAFKNAVIGKIIDDIRGFRYSPHSEIHGMYFVVLNLMLNGLYDYQNASSGARAFTSSEKNNDDILAEITNDNQTANKLKKLMYLLDTFDMGQKTIVDFYEEAKKADVLDLILYNQGYFDIYNDEVYDWVEITQVNNQAVLNIYEKNYISDYDSLNYLYPRFYKQDNVSYDNSKYPKQHCTNNVYNGLLFIFPFDGVTYIINTDEKMNLKKIEVRSPVLFNTDYAVKYTADFPDTKEGNKLSALHRVSNMGTFSYKDNIVYSMKDKKVKKDVIDKIINYALEYKYGWKCDEIDPNDEERREDALYRSIVCSDRLLLTLSAYYDRIAKLQDYVSDVSYYFDNPIYSCIEKTDSYSGTVNCMAKHIKSLESTLDNNTLNVFKPYEEE